MWRVTPSIKYIQGQNRNQTCLFPVSLEDSIEFDNEVRLIDLFVDSLSLKDFGFKVVFVENGRPAYKLRRIMNIIGKKELKSRLSTLTSVIIRIFKQISSHKFSLSHLFIQTENQAIIFEIPSKTLNLA